MMSTRAGPAFVSIALILLSVAGGGCASSDFLDYGGYRVEERWMSAYPAINVLPDHFFYSDEKIYPHHREVRSTEARSSSLPPQFDFAAAEKLARPVRNAPPAGGGSHPVVYSSEGPPSEDVPHDAKVTMLGDSIPLDRLLDINVHVNVNVNTPFDGAWVVFPSDKGPEIIRQTNRLEDTAIAGVNGRSSRLLLLDSFLVLPTADPNRRLFIGTTDSEDGDDPPFVIEHPAFGLLQFGSFEHGVALAAPARPYPVLFAPAPALGPGAEPASSAAAHSAPSGRPSRHHF